MKSPRDHGYGDAPEVSGKPTLGRHLDQACPHCGCVGVCEVSVEVSNPPPMLRRPTEPHKVIGRYVNWTALVNHAHNKGLL